MSDPQKNRRQKLAMIPAFRYSSTLEREQRRRKFWLAGLVLLLVAQILYPSLTDHNYMVYAEDNFSVSMVVFMSAMATVFGAIYHAITLAEFSAASSREIARLGIAVKSSETVRELLLIIGTQPMTSELATQLISIAEDECADGYYQFWRDQDATTKAPGEINHA